MDDSLLSPLVERAIRVSSMAHQGQLRKGSDIPYIAHPAAVALILQQAGFADAAIIAAAWLHDVLEDTDVTLEELRRDFPESTVLIVEAMTEQKIDAAGEKRPWRVRKADHLEAMRKAPVSVLAVMLADKLHNLQSIRFDIESGVDVWTRFNASRSDVLQYYRSMIALAGPHESLSRLHDECESLLRDLSCDERRG